MNHILINWKTSLAGLIVSIAGYVQFAYPQYAVIAQGVLALAGGVGLIAAKDANISTPHPEPPPPVPPAGPQQ